MNIIITGGGEGLGFAMAERLTKQNNVIIVGIKQEIMQPAAEKIGCDYKICDITDVEQVKKTIAEVERDLGQIDLLVNNAGVWTEGRLEDEDDGRIKKVLEVNTLGSIYTTKYTLPLMKKRNAGTIINIISSAGISAKSERSVYYASKWAMTGFTKCLQEELKGTNIRVMGFYPSLINTTMYKNAGIERNDLNKGLKPDEIAKTIEFVLTLDPTTSLTEVGIRNINY